MSLAKTFLSERPQLVRIARKLLRNAELAEEVVQDAYLRIAEGPCDRKVERPVGYCCQIVRNLALDQLRRQDREEDYRCFDVDVELLELPGCLSPERIVFERQAMAMIDAVLADLPSRKRQAFELHRLKGLTQRQIALQMGCALGLVNAWIAEVGKVIGDRMGAVRHEF